MPSDAELVIQTTKGNYEAFNKLIALNDLGTARQVVINNERTTISP